MTLKKWSFYAYFVVTNLIVIQSANALPFSITPSSTVPFPTTIASGTTVYATYIVQNNTNIARQNNYIKYLPPNVFVMSTGCGHTFNLAAKGQSGDSCELNLAITGAVARNDANIKNHLFVCFPQGISCAGTEYPLNISVLSGVNHSGFNALAHQGTTIYAGGANTSNAGNMWRFMDTEWSTVFTGNPSSPVEAIATDSSNLAYLGGQITSGGTSYSAWVYEYNNTNQSTTDTGFMASTNATTINSLTLNGSTVYAGGIDSSGQQGQVWSYDGSTWTSLGLSSGITEVSSVLYSPIKITLYAAELNNGSSTTSQQPYAQVEYYDGTSWTTTGLPTSDQPNYFTKINALAIDNVGNLYAGGVDANQNTAVWMYTGLGWITLASPSSTTGGEIYALAFNSHNVLFTAGFDGLVGQVWYYQNNTWVSMNLSGSRLIQSMTIDSDNLLYAGGIAQNNLSGIWSMLANVS